MLCRLAHKRAVAPALYSTRSFAMARACTASKDAGRPSVGLKIENFTDNEFWKQARKIDHGRVDYVAGLRAGKNVPTRK